MTAPVDALAQYRHDVALYSAPLTVVCPSCRAVRGAHCRSSYGNWAPFHPARKAIVESLPESERVAAVESLRADRHRAQMAPVTPLTTAQQRVRAQTAAAVDALDGPEVA